VNSSGTLCFVCHSSSSTAGSTANSTGGVTMSGHKDDNHQVLSSGSSSRGSDHRSSNSYRGSKSNYGHND
jgi:hypothetical protein